MTTFTTLALPFGVGADGPPAAEAWTGEFSYRTSGSESYSAYGTTETWSYEGRVQGTMDLDTYVDTPDRYTGHVTATLHFHATRTEPGGNCTKHEEYLLDGPPENTHRTVADAELILRQSGWSLRLGRDLAKGVLKVRVECRDGAVEQWPDIEFGVGVPHETSQFPYAVSGSAQSASFSIDGANPIGGLPQGMQGLTWQGDIHVRPRGDLVLEVDSAEYTTWRPSAGVGRDATAQPGKPIDFTATLRHTSGKPADETIERIEWELIDTSREPGIAINFPPNGSQEPDLRFEPLAGQVAADADQQKIAEESPPKGPAHARVTPLDWGAWSVLQVTAHMSDGQTITGRYKGSDEEQIRLPRRQPDSLIADSWKQANSGADGADDSDDDNVPTGDGYAGDGLTLYEEYRGFYSHGAHVSGDPKVRDYFVQNQAGALGESGMRLVQHSAQLAVRGLLETEMDPDSRVVNRLHARGPHVIDQHGVTMKYDPDPTKEYSEALGGPGTPKSISAIMLNIGLATDKTPTSAAIVAHELLHAVNVAHHGNGDGYVQWYIDGDQLRIGAVGSGNPLTVLDESGLDLTANFVAKLKVANTGGHVQIWQGAERGEHSGDENCLMRYTNSHSYIADGHPSIRYFVQSERVGTSMCHTAKGSGVNAKDNFPQSRYGDAAANHGDCAAQIRVSDRGDAPRR